MITIIINHNDFLQEVGGSPINDAVQRTNKTGEGFIRKDDDDTHIRKRMWVDFFLATGIFHAHLHIEDGDYY